MSATDHPPTTWCIDQSARPDALTSRIAHAFPDLPNGNLATVALCGLRAVQRQDVAHTHYDYTRCARCASAGRI